jgi:hypothetical protein
VQNLSHLADGSLVMNSSMQGGNTVSVNPPFSPIGSESEAYHGIETHSQPNPDLDPNDDHNLNTKGNTAGEFSMTPSTWKKVT